MTLPANIPPEFDDALARFAEDLSNRYASPVAGDPEDQLKGPIQDLLRAAQPDVITKTESRISGVGRPDIGVDRLGALRGYVELKAPGRGARVSAYKGHDREQWRKFKDLPNLLYTDGSEWALYRPNNGSFPVVRFSGDVMLYGKQAITREDGGRLHTLLVEFLNWDPIPPKTARELADTLAPLCRLLRDDVVEALRDRNTNLASLADVWRRTLFPEAEDHQFADAYAQTLTYALLLARLNGETHLTTASAADALDSGHHLLADALRSLTHPQTRREIATSVDVLERVIAAVEPVQIQERGDPWLYFYEDFLAAYDKKLRNDRGVYYTPWQVIQAQVNLGGQLLQERFQKLLTYADDGVVFLDPAAGTAAYPLAAMQHGLDEARNRFGDGNAPARASEAAQNIHAFELLVGPYAVAHLRLTNFLREAGGQVPADGVHVYLTDTLEAPDAPPRTTELFPQRTLTEEHLRAQRVKLSTRVLVCMGNPPYDREQRDPADENLGQAKGGWVRFGDRRDTDATILTETRGILSDFIEPAKAAGQQVHVKNLYNDYVYFWRWALWKVFETTQEPGVVSFITASSYLRGPGFVGMRQKMRELLDELWIIDLEGDQLGARKTENVFAIRTPVAIAIGIRNGPPQPTQPAIVRYTRLEGTRDEKLESLRLVRRFSDLEWHACFKGWMQPFLPTSDADYFSWPLITDLFPWQHSGSQLKRTWPIGETVEVLERRWRSLLALPAAERALAFKPSRDRQADQEYPSLFGDGRLPPITTLPSEAPMIRPVPYGFRSFDRQFVIPDGRLGDFFRPPLWNVYSDRQVYLTSLLTGVLGSGPAATVSAFVPDLHHFRGSFGGKDAVPLWRDAGASKPNITGGVLDLLAEAFGNSITADDLFHYTYALLASRAFVETFSEELTVPGLHLPVTRDKGVFDDAVTFGRELVWLHTFGERFVPAGGRRGEIPQGKARNTTPIPTSTDGYPNEFHFDEPTRTLHVGAGSIAPVTPEMYEWSISGFKVVQSWLSYRMRSGSGKTSSNLDKIRPDYWTAQMTEELLRLLWILERTIELQDGLQTLLKRVFASPLFRASDFPSPTEAERRPDGMDGEEPEDAERPLQKSFWDERQRNLSRLPAIEEDSAILLREESDEA